MHGAESLNLKPGAWETTTTMITSGSKLPPELSAKLTPEQRAKMEESFKARDGKPMTMTDRSCMTKEDISDDRIFKEMKHEDDEKDAKCTIKVISTSSSKLVVDRMCTGRRALTTHTTIEAKTPESFVVITDGETSGFGKAHGESKGRWLGASCERIEN